MLVSKEEMSVVILLLPEAKGLQKKQNDTKDEVYVTKNYRNSYMSLLYKSSLYIPNDC
jgi:hypothetical protein